MSELQQHYWAEHRKGKKTEEVPKEVIEELPKSQGLQSERVIIREAIDMDKEKFEKFEKMLESLQKEIVELKERDKGAELAELKKELSDIRNIIVSYTESTKKPPIHVKTKHEIEEEKAKLLEKLLNERRR